MKTADFTQITTRFSDLNLAQIKHLKKALYSQSDSKKTALLLSKKPHKVCPRCESENIQKFGFQNDIQRYRCKACKRTFNELTHTPLARLGKKGRWLEFAKCMTEGKTVRESAKSCNVHRNTSFRWRHKFLTIPKTIKPKKLSGIVELEEIYFPFSRKGEKKPQNSTSSTPDGSTVKSQEKTQVCVLIARDRNCNTTDTILDKFDANNLKNKILDKISKDALVCSNASKTYCLFTKENHIRHGKLELEKGQHTVKDIIHIRNTNKYHLELKKWMARFRGVATKYLDAYLGWFRNLDEFNMDMHQIALLLRTKSSQMYLHQP